MVFNATFNNISVISWRSVLFVEETGDPENPTDTWIELGRYCDYDIHNISVLICDTYSP
jgi:hypothetical protein